MTPTGAENGPSYGCRRALGAQCGGLHQIRHRVTGQAGTDAVLDAAEIVSRAAWSPPATRWLWLPRQLRSVNSQVESIEDAATKRKIDSARKAVR